METFWMTWYERVTQRHDLSDATIEIGIILVVACVLGFLCSYIQSQR